VCDAAGKSAAQRQANRGSPRWQNRGCLARELPPKGLY
jgi:hypothetical protein